MSTLREESMLCLANDLEEYIDCHTTKQTVEEIYHEFLDFEKDLEHNFWTINHDEDDLSQEDFMTLIQICARITLYPPGWVDTGGPGASRGHMDRMLKHYYMHVCVEEKDWVCEKIQEKLNKV